MRLSLFLILISFLSSCGEGTVSVDPDQGNTSSLDILDLARANRESAARDFYYDNLFTIMSLETATDGGCASAGCHLLGDAVSNAQTFFQVDPSNQENSWNWARFRRKEESEASDYSTTSSQVLQDRKDDQHEAFFSWTDEQKELLDEWSSMNP